MVLGYTCTCCAWRVHLLIAALAALLEHAPLLADAVTVFDCLWWFFGPFNPASGLVRCADAGRTPRRAHLSWPSSAHAFAACAGSRVRVRVRARAREGTLSAGTLDNGSLDWLSCGHCFCGAGCLVVSPRYRKEGRGDSMLSFLERTAISAGVSRLFALSTRTMQWFTERGFVEVPVSELPERRQRTINLARGSKVFMKGLNSPRELDAEELLWAADAPQSRQARGG